MFGFFNKKEAGAIVIDGHHTASTSQCVHCGNHEIIRPGSGAKRGFCTLCHGFLCGRQICMDNCIPFEAKLEYQEALNVNKSKAINRLLSRYPNLNLI